MRSAIVVFMIFTQVVFAKEIYYYNNHKKVTLRPISSMARDMKSVDYYENSNNIMLGVSNRLIVRLKERYDLKEILKKFDLKVVKSLGKDIYLLETKDKNLTIDIANRVSRESDVEYAQPDFLKKRVSR